MFDVLLVIITPPHATGFYAALIILGCAIGILTGLFGAGGGFILTPGLNIFFGIPFPNAVGISLAQIFVTCTSSAFKHWRRKNVDIKLSVIMALAAICGSFAGKQLMDLLQQHTGTISIAGHDFSELVLIKMFTRKLRPVCPGKYRVSGFLRSCAFRVQILKS